MRFGGHQTFTIRDGWLYKGLELLMNKEESWKLTDDLAMDYLGVGRNMAKSINHWLLATGLAQKATQKNEKTGKTKELKELLPTVFAEVIWENDPYFLDTNTWWFIHINLVNNANEAATWNWFFNNFNYDRFQKDKAITSLERFEKINSSRAPSTTTLDRDISCFLNTYSVSIPSSNKEPEDEIDCPLNELGLMKSFKKSGYFEVNRARKQISIELFLYSLSITTLHQEKDDFVDIPFFDMTNLNCGPSKVFLLNNEDIFELLMEYDSAHSDIKIRGMAGERLIKYKYKQPIDWVKTYYKNLISESI